MNAPLVRVTPLMVQRLAKLAEALNYTGPQVEEELPTDEMRAGLAELGRLAFLHERAK